MRLYRKFISIHIKSAMQYKLSFFMSVFAQFLVSFEVFLGIHFMMSRFHTVGGFTYSEVLLCYSVVLLQFSVAEMVFRGFDRFALMLGNGQFDRILVRPRNTVFQVLTSRFELTRIGRVLQSAVLLPYSICTAGIDWNAARALTLVLMIVGGVILFAAIFVFGAAFSFFTTEGLEFVNLFTDGAKEHGKYPYGVYGKHILRFCTYVVPYALTQYYPLLYILGWVESPAYIFLPLLAAWFLLPAYLLWRVGLKRYKSTGS